MGHCFFCSLWRSDGFICLQLAENSNQHLRNLALDALDRSICAVLGSSQFEDRVGSVYLRDSQYVSCAQSKLVNWAWLKMRIIFSYVLYADKKCIYRFGFTWTNCHIPPKSIVLFYSEFWCPLEISEDSSSYSGGNVRSILRPWSSFFRCISLICCTCFQRHGEKLHDSWQDILEMLRYSFLYSITSFPVETYFHLFHSSF